MTGPRQLSVPGRIPHAVRPPAPTGPRAAVGHGPGPFRPSARGLPEGVRARMEAAFGTDFSAVTVREDDALTPWGLAALTRGEAITVRSGLADLHSPEGLEVIGHELAHVLQQRAGRVAGTGLTEDPVLEAEADDAGRRVAQGEPVGSAIEHGTGTEATGGPSGASVAQPKGGLGRFVKKMGRLFSPRSGSSEEAPEPEPEPEPEVEGSTDAQQEELLAALRAPTDILEELRQRAIALNTAYVRAPNPDARAAAKAAYDKTIQDIADEEDLYYGTPGLSRRQNARRAREFAALIAENEEAARVEALFVPGQSQEPEYFRTPTVGPDVHVPGTEPPYIQTPAASEYSAAPVLPRRPGQ